MAEITTYYKNSNTCELVKSQEFTKTKITEIPIYYYDIHGKSIDTVDLTGYVEIGEKKYNRETKKQLRTQL